MLDRLFDFAMDVRIELSIELEGFITWDFAVRIGGRGKLYYNRRMVIFVNVRLNFEFYEDVRG